MLVNAFIFSTIVSTPFNIGDAIDIFLICFWSIEANFFVLEFKLIFFHDILCCFIDAVIVESESLRSNFYRACDKSGISVGQFLSGCAIIVKERASLVSNIGIVVLIDIIRKRAHVRMQRAETVLPEGVIACSSKGENMPRFNLRKCEVNPLRQPEN